jgi:hypothetical protein
MNKTATKARTMFIILSLAMNSELIAPTHAQETTRYQYPDVPRGHWASEAINHLDNDGGWVEGYPNGNYGGDKVMKRYEFARVISIFGTIKGFTPKFYTQKAMRLQPINVVSAQHQQWTEPEYPDVPRGHWGYSSVSVLSKMGVIEGLPNGTFRGNISLTRYDCAVAIARLLNRLGLPSNRDGNAESKKDDALVMPSYPDVPETHWAFHAISTLSKQGIFEGFADGNYHGSKPMSRYEFAVTLARVLRLGSR